MLVGSTQVVKSLAERLSQEDCFSVLIKELVVIMKGQAKEGTNASAAVQTKLLFQRLAPLLMLRVLPLDVFARVCPNLFCCPLCFTLPAVRPPSNKRPHPILFIPSRFSSYNAPFCLLTIARGRRQPLSANQDGRQDPRLELGLLLLDIMLEVTISKDVRKVAAELYARLPPEVVLPALARALDAQGVPSSDLLTPRVIVLSTCNALVYHKAAADMTQSHEQIVMVLTRILQVPVQDVSTATGPGDGPMATAAQSAQQELMQLQHGCIDLLALMSLQTARGSASPRRRPLIVDLSDESTAPVGATKTGTNHALIATQSMLQCTASSDGGGAMATVAQQQICAANAVVLMAQHADQ